MQVTINVLGGLEVVAGEQDCTPTAPKVQQVLAMLIARVNRVVPAATLTTELWDENPPSSAPTTLQTYIYQLRKVFSDNGITGPNGDILRTRGNGYVLEVDPARIDECAFLELLDQGRSMMRARHYEATVTLLRRAMRLWNGAPYTGVVQGRLLQGHVLLMSEARNEAVQQCVEAELALGHHQELIGELHMLLAEQPFNEWLHGKLIQALGRSGRRGEALDAYQRMRHILGEELGLDPSEESRRLHQELLNA